MRLRGAVRPGDGRRRIVTDAGHQQLPWWPANLGKFGFYGFAQHSRLLLFRRRSERDRLSDHNKSDVFRMG